MSSIRTYGRSDPSPGLPSRRSEDPQPPHPTPAQRLGPFVHTFSISSNGRFTLAGSPSTAVNRRFRAAPLHLTAVSPSALLPLTAVNCRSTVLDRQLTAPNGSYRQLTAPKLTSFLFSPCFSPKLTIPLILVIQAFFKPFQAAETHSRRRHRVPSPPTHSTTFDQTRPNSTKLDLIFHPPM